MRRLFSMLSAIALACASISRTTAAVHVANSLTPNVSPPQNGGGNAAARRAAKKRRQKLRAKQIGRRKR